MASISNTKLLFITIIITLFVSSLIFAILGGIDAPDALIWVISNFLNVSYPNLIPAALATNNTMLLISDLMGAFDFPILTVFIAAIFFDAIRTFNYHERLMLRRIKKYNGHIILAPYNPFAEILSNDLDAHNISHVIITNNEKDAIHLYHMGKIAIVGDESLQELLEAAGIKKARALVLCGYDSIKSTLVAVTARSASKRVKIIARISHFDEMVKLNKAGVERTILPEVTTGIEISTVILSKIRNSDTTKK